MVAERPPQPSRNRLPATIRNHPATTMQPCRNRPQPSENIGAQPPQPASIGCRCGCGLAGERRGPLPLTAMYIWFGAASSLAPPARFRSLRWPQTGRFRSATKPQPTSRHHVPASLLSAAHPEISATYAVLAVPTHVLAHTPCPPRRRNARCWADGELGRKPLGSEA
jgi:hypothetical protein